MRNITRITVLFFAAFLITAGCKSQPEAVEQIDRIQNIFAGVADVFILMDDNLLWGAGYNRSGQLGRGEISSGEPSIEVINDANGTPFTGVRLVAAGENHSVILKDDGTLWGAGDSSNGELGIEGEKLLFFTQLKSADTPISGARTVAAGNNSTFFISDDGSLWAAGYNYYGELGLGSREVQKTFVKVESAGLNVKAVAAGIRHTALLKEDGTLWVAGYNFNGQLGLGDTDDRYSFTEAKGAGSGIIAVAAGNYHTVILKSDGSVWTAGSNYRGQLGFQGSGDLPVFTRVLDENGSAVSGIREIAARGDITVLVKEDGTLLLAGNYTDPAAMFEAEASDAASGASQSAAAAEAEEGEKPLDTEKSSFVPLLPEQGAAFGGVKKIVLGYNSIYVIASDGMFWVAGSNRYGQLSLDFETETLSVLKLINP